MKKWLLFLLCLLALLAFFLRRYVLALVFRLPLPRYRVRVASGLRIPTRDSLTLAADHYYPHTAERFPTVLIRSPYGRNVQAGVFGFLLAFFAHRFAERGYHVLVQDTRGRFDSDGEFEPYFPERADGLATLDWLQQQPWFNGVVGTWGPSYLGIVQWVIADSPLIKALVPSVTAARLYDIVFPDGAFDLGMALRWMALFRVLDRHKNAPLPLVPVWGALMLPQAELMIRPALRALPVIDDDIVTTKQRVSFYHTWLQHARPDDPLWQETLDAVDMNRVYAPVQFIGGWHDFFLRALLRDYQTLRAAGHRPHLIIGPWHHFSHMFTLFDSLEPGLRWFDTYLKGQNRLRKKPVRIYVMGARQWRELPDYPPPSTPLRFYLSGDQRLARQPADAPPDQYTYDPATPTPAVGGTQFYLFGGARNNRPLLRRRDVLRYTSQRLSAPLEIIGAVTLELYVKSSLPYTDFFGRLCDLYPDGRTINVCDGLFRIEPGKGQCQPDGSLRIEIDLWSTAYRFRKGHRIRLLVASGAHPRWARNLGSDDQIMSASFAAAQQTVFHDIAHPSALVLPLVN